MREAVFTSSSNSHPYESPKCRGAIIGRIGGVASILLDPRWAPLGYTGGLSANFWIPLAISDQFSVGEAGQIDIEAGGARISGQSQVIGSLAMRLGPRLRLGAPLSFTLGAYYELPFVNYSQESAYFPLVGLAADVGAQYHDVALSAMYRHDYNGILYPARPDFSFVSLSLTFASRAATILPNKEAPLDVHKIKDDAARTMVEDELRQQARLGIIATTISDQKFGATGYAAGVEVIGPSAEPKAIQPGASIIGISSSIDALFGSAQISGTSQFVMSGAARFGPRVRLGAPFALTFGAYYDAPVAMFSQKSLYFPLIGIAGDAGFQYGPVRLVAVYRYDFNTVLYPDRPNLSFFGIALTGLPYR